MIRMAIRRPVTVTMAYVAVAILGVAAWRNLPIELLPNTELPQLTVRASWPGASPEVTEALLTSPLEAAVQQVRGVETVRSESYESDGWGRAQVRVEFARSTDMEFARLELSERLAALEEELPPAARRTLRIEQYVPDEFEEQSGPFLRYTITGPFTLEALRAHIDDIVAPALRQVDGVAEVTAQGGRERVLELELDNDKIQSLGLGINSVRQRVAELSFVTEAGAAEVDGRLRALAIRHRAGSVTDILSVPVLSGDGRVVRLRDVATVNDAYEDPRSHYRIDALPAVSFTVHREVGTNAVAVADRVKERVGALESQNPPGVRLLLDRDESEDIKAQLTDLRFRALVAAIVIFAVLVLFLQSVRSAGMVFATIAFSILITLNLVYFGGFTLNVLTLMGLAMGFGLIVDNAIVVLENVYRRWRTGERPPDAAEQGARDVVLPIVAATVTTLVVLVPFVYLQGELRIYYVPLAIVVGFSLGASLLVAFSFIPGVAARLLRGGALPGFGAGRDSRARGAAAHSAPDAAGDDAAQRDPGDASGGSAPGGGADGANSAARRPFYVRFYAALVGFTIRHPWVTVVLAAAILGGSYHLFDKYVTRGVRWGAWWGEDTYISVQIRQPRGEELTRTDELARYFENRLRQMPEVERFVTTVRPQYARIYVTFPDSLEHTAVPIAIKEQMVAFSHLFGGTEVRVYGYGPSFYGGGSSPPNYRIKILGYNYETVREIAEGLARRLTRFSRIHEVDTNSAGNWFRRDRATELVLRVDRPRLALHGLTARDVVQQVAAAVRGRMTQDRIQLAGEEVRFDVKLAGHRDIDMLELQNLLVRSPSGAGVRLADVATLDEREVLSRVIREDQQYQRLVTYEFRGPRKLGDVVKDAVIGATRLPPGYEIEEEDRFRWSDDERAQIYRVLALSLILIFMVTAALFESFRQPLCVLLAVPMALVGVFLIFFYTGANFTREAYVGVIMMGGVVVNNAILLVDHVNRLRRKEGLALEPAVVRGTVERVRPILMTTATTIFGLLPLVLFSETANSNIWNALAYALIGGLASSTIFVLTVTPALYYLFERRPERRRLARAGALAPTGALGRTGAVAGALLAASLLVGGCGVGEVADARAEPAIDTVENSVVVVRDPDLWIRGPTVFRGPTLYAVAHDRWGVHYVVRACIEGRGDDRCA